MVWFFQGPSDAESRAHSSHQSQRGVGGVSGVGNLLISALPSVLSHHPVLCGRYTATKKWEAIQLNNQGVQVYLAERNVTLQEAVSHLPGSELHANLKPAFFKRDVHEAFVPPKEGMDPDTGNAEMPLMRVQLTTLKDGGIAVGILVQHAVMDAAAIMVFMRNWAQAVQNLPLHPEPVYQHRELEHDGDDSDDKNNDNDNDNEEVRHGFMCFPADGPTPMPPFAGLMEKINGPCVCVAPFPQRVLRQLKASASVSVSVTPDQETFVSTDDLVTARVWKALCAMRCEQLSLSKDDSSITTCQRACNFRKRMQMPPTYCGNGVDEVRTELSVRDLLAMPVVEIARRLRADLRALTPDVIMRRSRWMQKQYVKLGNLSKRTMEANALTFIVSSWRFDWEGVNLMGTPVAYDHGALVPVVAVITPRPRGDGIHVYASGSRQHLEIFANELIKEIDV
ncbi:transferase [Pycnococcus provasolii]